MRRLAILFALVVGFSALILAQFPASGGTAQAPLVIAQGVAARALAINTADSGANLYVTNASQPNRIFALSAGSSNQPAGGSAPPLNSASGIITDNAALTQTASSGSAPASASAVSLVAFAGTGAAGSTGDGGIALSAEFSLSPDSLFKRSGVVVAPDGTIYVADTQNSTIRAIASSASTEPGVVRSVAGRWATGQNVSLSEPLGVAVDRAGDLFIADHTAGTVDEIPAGGQLEILAHVIAPANVAVSPDGSKVFVASPDTGAVFAVTVQTRAINTVPGFTAGGASQTPSAAPGPCAALGNSSGSSATTSGNSAQAICPAGLAVDGAANLFVSDAGSGRILRVDAKSSAMTVSASGLHIPGSLAFDASGNLYIAEQGTSRILAVPQAGAAASNISIAPASATYRNEPVGGNTPNQLFTVTNSSASAVTDVNLKVGGTNPNDFQIQGQSCLVSLGANSSCTVSVDFVPQATGARSATLNASDSVSTDTASAGLSGTGDDFQMIVPASQPDELSIQQGGTATFNAQIVPDSTFGKNGEKVILICPSNVPTNTECSFNPASISVTPGAASSFQVTFVTTNILGTTGGFPFSTLPPNPGGFFRGPRGGGPNGTAPIPTLLRRIRNELSLFSALAALLSFGALLLALKRRRRMISGLAFAMFVMAALAGCHHSTNVSAATPVGTTTMAVQGNAVDANGNSLNASRTVSITLNITSD